MKKRIYTIAALFLMALGLTACSSGPKPEDASENITDSSAITFEGQPESGEIPEANASPVSAELTYGKVKQIIGNEITIRLARLPETEGESQDQLPEGGAIQGAPLDAGAQSVPAAGAVAANSSGTGEAEEHLELDYLDEEKTFTIPAGTMIYDQASGQEVPLSSLKKGAVLMIVSAQETDAVTEIVIWEQA